MKSSLSPENHLRPGERLDSFLDGRLKVIQPAEGYRASIDSVLLSRFVTIRPRDTVVDLGTGCGIILLILLLTRPVEHGFGLEIQEELANQAARNAWLNGLEDKMTIIRGDIRHPPIAHKSADVVVCNPPYRQAFSGRLNPNTQKAIARHEILASLDHILGAACRILRTKGRLAVIYPAFRLVDALTRLRDFALEPKKIQFTHPTLHSEANLALVESTLNGRPGVTIKDPFIGQGENV